MFFRVSYVSVTNTLLIHGDGTNGSTIINDVAGHAITRYGNTQVSTNQSVFGGASLLFDGSGDFLSLPISADWAFGCNDFTVDLWANFQAMPGSVVLIGPHTAGAGTEWSMAYDKGALLFLINGFVILSNTWNPELNTWYHLTATRTSNVLRLFVNGTMVASMSNATNIGNTRTLTIGAANNPTFFFNGYAFWTDNFTPPSAPYSQ